MAANKPRKLAAVTGAFSYSGRYIAAALLDKGWEVITLTRQPERPHPLQARIKAYPLDFGDPSGLAAALKGVEVFVNTYWVRFDYPGSSFAAAIENTGRLLEAAKAAGVRRFVHLSVSNADAESTLPYYRGKAQVEAAIQHSGLSYAILRPTLIFGQEEVLVNNITWLLRRLPVFAIPGDGKYRLQPIFVEDLAQLVATTAGKANNELIRANGSETFNFEGLLRFLAGLFGRRVWMPHLPSAVALFLSKLVGLYLGDVMLTRAELQGLMEERLFIDAPSAASTRFSDWARAHAGDLGRRYAHELKRHHGR